MYENVPIFKKREKSTIKTKKISYQVLGQVCFKKKIQNLWTKFAHQKRIKFEKKGLGVSKSQIVGEVFRHTNQMINTSKFVYNQALSQSARD